MGTLSKVTLIVAFVISLGLIVGLYSMGSLKPREESNVILVEVDYFNHWNATISVNGETEDTSHFGKKIFVYTREFSNVWTLLINCKKGDGSASPIHVRIKLQDGTVLKQATTTEPYGIIMLSYETT